MKIETKTVHWGDRRKAGNCLFTRQRKLKDAAGGQGELNGASLMSAKGPIATGIDCPRSAFPLIATTLRTR